MRIVQGSSSGRRAADHADRKAAVAGWRSKRAHRSEQPLGRIGRLEDPDQRLGRVGRRHQRVENRRPVAAICPGEIRAQHGRDVLREVAEPKEPMPGSASVVVVENT